MRFTPTTISDAFVVELETRIDARGFFARAWCSQELRDLGMDGDCAQANLSYNTRRGTLRGMHFQLAPHGEAKLVRVIRGAIHDVSLDLRPHSQTFGKWFATELTAENRRAVFVPEGCAHGYLTLTDHSEVLYLVSKPYHPASARGLMWNSHWLRGAWPFEPQIISEQDCRWPEFHEFSEKRSARGFPLKIHDGVDERHGIEQRSELEQRRDTQHVRHPAVTQHIVRRRAADKPAILGSPAFQFVPDLRSKFVLF